MPAQQVDFARVNSAALASVDSLLSRLLPGGRIDGKEYVVADLTGGHGGSTSINRTTGIWKDFATGQGGKDLVSLYAAVRGIGQVEAAKALAQELGVNALESPLRSEPKRRVAKSYDYLSPEGEIVFQVTRWEPKHFTQRRPDGQGGWINSVKDIQLVPYHLPEVLGAQAVFIVEGEKDADALAALGLVGTCNAQGAGKWKPEYSQWLKDKRVCILPDNDDPGRKHAQDVAKSLHGIAAAVKIVEIPGLPAKGDLSDWLAAGGTKDDLLSIAKAAPEWLPSGEEPSSSFESSSTFRFLSLSDILAAPRPPRWLIRDYIEADTLSVLFGEAGSMKSFLAIDQGLCIASATPWHGQVIPNPGPVFYLAGEGFHGLSRRIQAWIKAHKADHSKIPFFVSSTPAQLLDEEHAQTVAAAVASLTEQHGAPRLVIVDTLNRNFGPGDENSSQDMTAFVSALDRLKARFGCSILVVHHSGLAEKGRSRGSSVLRAAADFEYRLAAKNTARVLSCTKSKDHEPPQDVAFEPDEVGTGWTDPETLEEITSCVLRQTEMPQEDERGAVSGAKRIALDALKQACESAGGSAHIDEWRKLAYDLGISKSGGKAQIKAFSRATQDLISAGLVIRENNTCSLPGRQGGQVVDMSTLSWGHRSGQSGHTPKGVSTCLPVCPLSDDELENPFSEVSHG